MSDTTSINDQILDAVKALNTFSSDETAAFTAGLARQALVQSVVLAMQDAVAAQQRNYLLRQALTTSIAKHALEASSAEEAMQIVEPHLAGDDIAKTLKDLSTLLEELDAKAKSATV